MHSQSPSGEEKILKFHVRPVTFDCTGKLKVVRSSTLPRWICSFDELCKRSSRGSRVGQRKWLESAAAETGKIKGERWMDRCARGSLSERRGEEKKGKRKKVNADGTNKRKKFQNSYVSVGRVGGGVLISIKSLSSARIPFETSSKRETERERELLNAGL